MFPGIPTVICGGFGQSAIFQVSLKLSIVLHLQNTSANRIKKKTEIVHRIQFIYCAKQL